MKRFAFFALLVSALSPAAAQSGSIADDIVRAKDAYKNNNFELARQIFGTIVTTSRQVTTEQRVTAYSYLGAYWASSPAAGARDSAKNYFLSAIDYDPFTVLDPDIFSPDERAAFSLASASTFRIGVAPPRAKAIDPTSANSDSNRYVFRVVATRSARLEIAIAKLNAATPTEEIIATLPNAEGPRDVPWNGLLNNTRADTGLYELKLTATDSRNTAATPLVERQRFRVEHVHATLEAELPPFRDVNTGATDTLRSRYSGFKPYGDGIKGLVVAGLATGLPFLATSDSVRGGMSGWKNHLGIGISLGAVAGFGAGLYAWTHRDDSRAVRENERRKAAREQFNAGVRARNTARLQKTILVIRPLTAGTG